MVSTRKQNYGHPANNNEQECTSYSSVITERRSRWSEFLRMQQYQPLVTEVLENELPKYRDNAGTLPESLAATVHECILILASAPLIFAAAVDGTLTQRFLTDTELQHEYTVIQERAHVQPSIYIHILADENGVAPTANQYLLIGDTARKYLSSERRYQELAWHIDNVTPPVVSWPGSTSGHRKFLWTKHRSPQHVDTLLRFCDGISNRWGDTPPAKRDLPFAFPPGECGYSVDSHLRLAQHRYRQSSNYVMNLAEDICSYLHRTGQLSQRFYMHQFIIYLIFRPQQAAIAEIFCSGLLQVWVADGGGFNAYPAGRSVASVSRVSERDWAAHEKWVSENTGLVENVKIQKERLEIDVSGLEKETEGLWRDALDSDGGGDGDDEEDEDYVPDDLSQGLSQLRLDS